jgi:hypothetical protein
MTESTEASGVAGSSRLSKISDATVSLNEDQRLVVEFRIQDLVRRLTTEGVAETSCGGCDGCMGCSM